MDKSLRLLVSLSFVAIAAGLPGNLLAAVKITISDGTTPTKGPGNFGGFLLTHNSPAGTRTHALLTCTTPPCTVYFPSGAASPQTGDTLKFRDATAARIIKTDSATDRLEVKGLEVTALNIPASGERRVEFKFWTEGNDLTPGSTGSSSYPLAVLLEGMFTAQTGRASKCPSPLTLTIPQLKSPCARMKLNVSKDGGITSVDIDGAGAPETVTASVPCKNMTGSPSPCGTGGSYLSNGYFKSLDGLDGSSFTCDATCIPTHALTLMATYGLVNERVSLVNSAVVAMARVTEEDFGVEELYASLGDKLEGNYWVWFWAANELYRGIPKKFDKGSFSMSGTTVPIAFGLSKASLTAATDGVTLTSIGTSKDGGTADALLPPREQARNERSYASYIAPQRLSWKSVRQLKLHYDYITGNSAPGDLRLPHLLPFSDCADGSFRLVVKLVDEKGANAGTLNIYLGGNDYVLGGCAAAAELLNGKNLVQDDAPRADPSALGGGAKCCMTIAKSQETYGDLFVRSVSVVVDQGVELKARSLYKVNLYDAVVNGSHANRDLAMVDTSSFEEIPTKNLPVSGRSLVITKVSGEEPIISKEFTDQQFQIIGQELRAEVRIKDLPDPEPGATYRATLCLFGGRCVPLHGSFMLSQ